MTIKRKDFQKAAALVHEFLLKLTDDTDCAELRDALNLALLHMQRYYRSLRNKLQNQDKREGNTLNLSIRGLSPMTPFKDAPDKFQWKWINLDNPRLSNTLELTKELSTLPQACVAAKEGETDRLVQLIEDDPDVVIETDGVGRTALAYAVHFGHLEALQQLLEHGADPNATANDGTTAVHRACHDGKHEALQILIEYNADLSIQDVQGRAPIHWACSNKNRECLKLLIEKEVSINIRDNEGMSPSMWACRMDHIDHFELLSQVTHQQIDEEDGLERDNNGRTWMHWSVRRMDPLECLKTLLTEEAAELQDTEGKSVMHVAAEQGSLPASKIILEIAGKPCLDHRDNTNRTPLMLATMGGHGEVVNYLLAEGSDLACVDDFGATAWDYARARQLHYCMLIIASYIREQAKNRPESQQGDDGDNARYPGLPDDNLGINSLQINGGGGDAEEQVYYGHHKPAPPPRVPEAPTTPRTPRAAIPSSRTPRSNGNGQRNNGFVSPAPPGSPQRNQPQPGSPSRNQAMKRSPSGQRDEEDEGMYDESHVREGSAEKRRRANDDGPQREMTLMSVNSYDLDAPDGPVPNHHDPPEHEEEMQNDSQYVDPLEPHEDDADDASVRIDSMDVSDFDGDIDETLLEEKARRNPVNRTKTPPGGGRNEGSVSRLPQSPSPTPPHVPRNPLPPSNTPPHQNPSYLQHQKVSQRDESGSPGDFQEDERYEDEPHSPTPAPRHKPQFPQNYGNDGRAMPPAHLSPLPMQPQKRKKKKKKKDRDQEYLAPVAGPVPVPRGPASPPGDRELSPPGRGPSAGSQGRDFGLHGQGPPQVKNPTLKSHNKRRSSPSPRELAGDAQFSLHEDRAPLGKPPPRPSSNSKHNHSSSRTPILPNATKNRSSSDRYDDDSDDDQNYSRRNSQRRHEEGLDDYDDEGDDYNQSQQQPRGYVQGKPPPGHKLSTKGQRFPQGNAAQGSANGALRQQHPQNGPMMKRPPMGSGGPQRGGGPPQQSYPMHTREPSPRRKGSGKPGGIPPVSQKQTPNGRLPPPY